MTQLKYSVPSVGEKNTVAEPKVDVALNEIKTVVNGELDNENLKAGGVAKSNLSAELKAELSSFVGLPLEARKTITSTEQERASAVYGTLPTADEVEVTLPSNGLIYVSYQALWISSVSGAGNAAIFLGGNQIKYAGILAEAESSTNVMGALSTTNEVNAKIVPAAAGLSSTPAGAFTFGTTGELLTKNTGEAVGIYAAAGTYKVSIRFKASSGNVKVKERRLRAWIIG